MDEQHLEAIRKRNESATPGPWVRQGGPPSVVCSANVYMENFPEARVLRREDGSIWGYEVSVCFARETDLDTMALLDQKWNDLDFIANARDDIPALLEEIDRLRDVIYEMNEEI